MAKMTKDEIKQKLKDHDMTASQFLDGLTELLCDTSGLTNEELREDLEANGVDVDKSLDEVDKILRKHGLSGFRPPLVVIKNPPKLWRPDYAEKGQEGDDE